MTEVKTQVDAQMAATIATLLASAIQTAFTLAKLSGMTPEQLVGVLRKEEQEFIENDPSKLGRPPSG